jgi:hypothetical protein
VETEERPYFKVRFRWWRLFDIYWFAQEYNGIYDVEIMPSYMEDGRIEIFSEGRREIRVKADTLYAFLTGYKAILFQKEVAALTESDKELEEFVLERYPHVRDTPFL